MLPSNTHRKPIPSITAVLLPFVTYLLTLPRMYLLIYVIYVFLPTPPIHTYALTWETYTWPRREPLRLWLTNMGHWNPVLAIIRLMEVYKLKCVYSDVSIWSKLLLRSCYRFSYCTSNLLMRPHVNRRSSVVQYVPSLKPLDRFGLNLLCVSKVFTRVSFSFIRLIIVSLHRVQTNIPWALLNVI
jgi:hypothetical protein